MNSRSTLRGVLFAVALATWEGNAATWKGGFGNWSDSDKWSDGVIPLNGVPTPDSHYTAEILASANGLSSVLLDISATVDNLYLRPGQSLTIPSKSTLGLDAAAGGTIDVGGTVRLDSSETSSAFIFISGGAATLTGGGELVLSDSPGNFIRGSDGSKLINQNVRISGAGILGDNILSFDNQGRIIASGTHPLILDTGLSSSVNSGLIQAEIGGTLRLNSGIYFNFDGGKAGSIRAFNGTVIIGQLAEVFGGVIEVAGSGELDLAGGTIRWTQDSPTNVFRNGSDGLIRIIGPDSAIRSVTLENPAGGWIVMDSRSFLSLADSVIQNDGEMRMNAVAEGDSTDLYIPYGATGTLRGMGQLILSDSPANRIRGANVTNSIFVNETNHTIRGAGIIGNNEIALVNRGLIQAAGLLHPLTIDPSAAGLTNTGVLASSGGPSGIGGSLVLGSGTIDNGRQGEGRIETQGGIVRLAGARVEGGDIRTTGGGEFQLSSGTLDAGPIYYQSVDITGMGILRVIGTSPVIGNARLDLNQGGTLVVDPGAILNFKTQARPLIANESSGRGIFLDGSSQAGADLFIGAETRLELSGPGLFTLSDSPLNRIRGAVSGQLGNYGNVISGAGNLGNNEIGLLNSGVIRAAGTNPLILDPGPLGFQNDGELRAALGSTLELRSGEFTNFSTFDEAMDGTTIVETRGRIVADGGIVRIDPLANIRGGDLETSASLGGELRLAGGSITDGSDEFTRSRVKTVNWRDGMIRVVANSTLGGNILNHGTLTLENGTRLTVPDGTTLENQGVIRVQGTRDPTEIFIEGGQFVLSGSGTISAQTRQDRRQAAAAPSGALMLEGGPSLARIRGGTRATLINRATIAGAGDLGNNSMAIENHGVILAANPGEILLINPNAQGFSSDGEVIVRPEATLHMQSNDPYRQTGGTLLVDGLFLAEAGVDLAGDSPSNVLTGEGVLRGGATISNGTYSPGGPVGILTIDGRLNLGPGAVGRFEITGPAAGRLEVAGAAGLNGALQVAVADGFIPPANDAFVILTAGSVAGKFANAAPGARLPTADGAGSFVVYYGANSRFSPSSVVLSDYEPAPRFSTPNIAADGSFEFTLTALPGTELIFETTDDFDQWIVLSTNVIPSVGTILIRDQNLQDGHRFYRAHAL